MVQALEAKRFEPLSTIIAFLKPLAHKRERELGEACRKGQPRILPLQDPRRERKR